MASTLGSFVFVTAAIVAAVNAHPQTFPGDYHRLAPRTEGFKWEPCPEGAGRQCSRFEVPLDWHDSSIGKASLAVARFPAVKEPKLGTLFVNPGGPGQSGRAMVIGPLGEVIRNASGGQYDILGWDPRGVGMSVPLARCAETIEDLQSIRLPAQPRGGIEARGNFTSKDDIDAFYAQIDEVDAGIKEFGKRCLEFSPHTFPYMGTAAVVRDMVAMHDVLEGKDKPIDYWGFSYGTIIGIYFANMFPDRVGRVILDGVVDPVYWANRLPHTGGSRSLESADEAFAGFALACATAGPKGCAIAFENSTADSIIGWTRNLLDAAYDYRRETGPDANITSDSIRGAIFDAMYQPLTWPMLAKDLKSLADQLASFFSGSNTTSQKRSTATPLFDLKRRQGNTTADDQLLISDLANTGVRCSDAVDPSGVTTKDVFEFIVNNTRDVSPMFGPRWFDAGYYCHHWPVRAVERYTGPWNKKLSNPILIIGNEADPITPYISAKRVADALGDSAILIEQDDYGHVSLAMHSDCTFAAVEDYFVNNKLPAQDKFCGTNQELFPGPGITKKVLAQLTASKGSGGTSLEADLQATKDRSQKLFIAVIALAAATGILLVSLMVSCMRGRRKGSINAAHIPRGVFEKAAAEEGQGHLYDAPYMPAGGSKAGGYSRVEA